MYLGVHLNTWLFIHYVRDSFLTQAHDIRDVCINKFVPF